MPDPFFSQSRFGMVPWVDVGQKTENNDIQVAQYKAFCFYPTDGRLIVQGIGEW